MQKKTVQKLVIQNKAAKRKMFIKQREKRRERKAAFMKNDIIYAWKELSSFGGIFQRFAIWAVAKNGKQD